MHTLLSRLMYLFLFLFIIFGEGTDNMQVLADSDSHDIHDDVTGLFVRNYPLDKIDFLLDNIWELTKSNDQHQAGVAWESFYSVWKYCDGMKCHFFTRFCWIKCKEEPLVFYLRYLTGDERSLKYYELASKYDIVTFKEDNTSAKKFMKILRLTEQAIADYNTKHSIRDNIGLESIRGYFSEVYEKTASGQ